MLEKFRAQARETVRRMAKDILDNTGEQALASDGAQQASEQPLEGESLDAKILTLESELAELHKIRDGESRPVHVWKQGQLPGAVKIRTCAGDASHASHWEKV